MSAMLDRRFRTITVLVLVHACGGDDGGADTTAGTTSGPSSTSTTMAGSGSGAETTEGSGTAGSETSSEECMGSVPGEWADCIDAAGQVDLVPCMAEEMPEVGTPFCLVASVDPMAGACTILSCEDDCDCFAMPRTGNIVPRCNRFTETGKACALPCADPSAVCPDGMACLGGLCYWPSDGGGTAGDGSEACTTVLPMRASLASLCGALDDKDDGKDVSGQPTAARAVRLVKPAARADDPQVRSEQGDREKCRAVTPDGDGNGAARPALRRIGVVASEGSIL